MVSIVVATKDIKNKKNILFNIKNLKGKYELIIVEGKNPSYQRNAGVKKAKGKIIYFLDDDSIPDKENIKRAINIFKKDKNIGVIGGPSLTSKNDNFLQKSFGFTLSNFFATFKSSARYKKAGDERETSEKEVILCNLFVKKDIFLKIGGFKEELYPNEENEFLNNVQEYGYKIIYSPDIFIYRQNRKNIIQFIKQCFNYGRGRAEQIFFKFTKNDLLNFIPSIFLIYLITSFLFYKNLFYFTLIIYFLTGFVFSIKNILFHKNFFITIILPFNFFVLHISYGIGFIYGIIKKFLISKKNINRKIKIIKVKK